jgi:hypothetical protein
MKKDVSSYSGGDHSFRGSGSDRRLLIGGGGTPRENRSQSHRCWLMSFSTSVQAICIDLSFTPELVSPIFPGATI